LALHGHVDARAIAGLCERLQSLVRGGADLVICDVRMLDTRDLVAIDALAHLKLVTNRLGCKLQLTRASHRLSALIAFAGLDEVLPSADLTAAVRWAPAPDGRPADPSVRYSCRPWATLRSDGDRSAVGRSGCGCGL
jgi:ABC-type transporter Mla MlaB component